MTLKALADAVLARNQPRNSCATDPEKARNFSCNFDTQKLRSTEAVATQETTGTQTVAEPPLPWQEWQAAHPSPGTVPLSADERQAVEAWLDAIDEHDNATRDDVLRTCAAFPDTKLWILHQAAALPSRHARLAEQAASFIGHKPKQTRSHRD